MNKNNDHISKEDVYRLRIAPIVDRIWEKDDVYQDELDKNEMIDSLAKRMQRYALDEFMAISESDLIERLGGILSVKLIRGMLSDLTSEEKRIFEEATTRR